MKQIYNQINLNTQFLLKNPLQIFIMLIFPFVAILLCWAIVPLKYSFPLVILFSSVLPTSIIYISIVFSWSKGTLKNNSSLNQNSKLIFYASTFIFMYIVCFAFMFITLSILSILSALNMLPGNYWWTNNDPSTNYHYNIWTVEFAPLIYSTTEALAILFTMCYFLQTIIDSTKIIYIILTFIMLMTMICGGTFDDYFNQKTLNYINEDGSISRTAFAIASDGLMPTSYFWAPAMFPFFAPGQHLGVVGLTCIKVSTNDIVENASMVNVLNPDLLVNASVHRYPDLQFFYWQQAGEYYSLSGEEKIIIDYAEATRWNIMWFLPYIWIVFFTLGGTAISKYNKK